MRTAQAVLLIATTVSATAWVSAQSPADTQRLVIRSLDGQIVRTLPLVGESNLVPMWSPDGRSIAFQVRERGRSVIGIVRRDGREPRVFRDAERAGGQSALWSPDSRTIGFLDPTRRTFKVLTVATGEIRTIATDSGAQIGVWRWRPDGRAIVAVKTTPGTQPGLRFLRRRVDEIALDGSRRPLLDTIAMRGVPGVTFIDATAIFVRYDSAAYRLSLVGSPPQRLGTLEPMTRAYAGVHNTAPSSALWAAVTPGELFEHGIIDIISARTGARRIHRVPFHPSAGPSPEWTPDGRALLVVGWPLEDTTAFDRALVARARGGDTSAVELVLSRSSESTVLYLVPTDNRTARRIATFRATDWWISVSPDGQYVVHGMTNSG